MDRYKRKRLERSRNWVFTLNNPLDAGSPRSYNAKYCIWQLESGDNGTPHLQGYAHFSAKKSMCALKKLEPRAHWEPRRGTHQEAKAYCQKEETRLRGPWSYGDEPKPGTRSDLANVKRDIEVGMSMRQITEKHFKLSARYFKFFQWYQVQCMGPRYKRPEIIIMWGPSGVGKTLACREGFGDKAYWKPKNKWWDGYGFQDTVIFDEFYGWLEYDLLLRILDWYPLIMETKGASVQFQSNRFVFTSNIHPQEWYPRLSAVRVDALRRRIAEFGTLIHWTKDSWKEEKWILEQPMGVQKRVDVEPYFWRK